MLQIHHKKKNGLQKLINDIWMSRLGLKLKKLRKVKFFYLLNNLHGENTVLTKRINKINKCYLAVNNLA